MFAVIQFSEKDGGTVSVVNHKWLTPRRCEVYWPPVKGTKEFDRLLSGGTLTPDESWKLYGVQRIFYETDNIEKAKKKLKLAEATSNLETEEEEIHPKKRQIQRTKRYCVSETSSDEDIHIRPPPLKKPFALCIREALEGTSSRITEALEGTSSRITEELVAGTTSRAVEVESETVSSVAHIQDISQRPQQHSQNQNFSDRASKSQSCAQRGDKSPTPLSATSLTGFESKLLSLLTLIKTQNDQIIELIKQLSIPAVSSYSSSLKAEFKFPLKTVEELKATELLLQDKACFENLVSHIRILGGRDISTKVTRILKFLFSDDLATNYNFYGKRSSKNPFCQLRLRDCVVEAVVTTTKATEKDVEDSIKTWLKHAPERVKKMKKRD